MSTLLTGMPHLQYARQEDKVLKGVGKALRLLVEGVEDVEVVWPAALPLVHWLGGDLRKIQACTRFIQHIKLAES